MKKNFFLTCILTSFITLGTTTEINAQFGSLLKKVVSNKKKKRDAQSSSKSSKSSSSGKFSDFNKIKDEMGLSGEYHSLTDKGTAGFKFVKENEGKIVNELHFWYKKQENPQLKMLFKESFYNKNQIKMFFVWNSTYAKSYIEVFEIAPGVLARTEQTQVTLNEYEQHVPVDIKRTVIDVLAKNKSDLETWDLETAQAKVDMILATLNSSAYAKVKKKLMRYDIYKKYKGKISFSKSSGALRASTKNKIQERDDDLITKRELGSSVFFKPYFDLPLVASNPGTWFNITYEMAGVKTDREVLRRKSTKYSNNIPQLNKYTGEFYFLFPHIILGNSNRHADYAFLELLRLAQDKLHKGKTYTLKVTVWAFKDGQNITPVAKNSIQLEYTANTKKLLTDPDDGLITILEDYLDE